MNLIKMKMKSGYNKTIFQMMNLIKDIKIKLIKFYLTFKMMKIQKKIKMKIGMSLKTISIRIKHYDFFKFY